MQSPTLVAPSFSARLMLPATTPVTATPRIAHDAIPRVIRRLLSEEKELVDHSQALAKDLPDPSGRARA